MSAKYQVLNCINQAKAPVTINEIAHKVRMIDKQHEVFMCLQELALQGFIDVKARRKCKVTDKHLATWETTPIGSRSLIDYLDGVSSV